MNAKADQKPAAVQRAEDQQRAERAAERGSDLVVSTERGRGLSTLRGILGPGTEVTPADFAADPKEGAKKMRELYEKGHLEAKRGKKKPAPPPPPSDEDEDEDKDPETKDPEKDDKSSGQKAAGGTKGGAQRK